MEIVLATRNIDKVGEIKSILAGLDLRIKTLDDYPAFPEVEEDGATFEENALKKARAVREETGLTALADDSGLEVEALDGAPGIYSSRFAGENVTYKDNNLKLLDMMKSVPAEKRAARFRCITAAALLNNEGAGLYKTLSDSADKSFAAVDEERSTVDALVTEGIVYGRIAGGLRGGSGFGYDPLFEVPSLGRTFAEIGTEEKNKTSHRFRALIEMRELLLRLSLVRESR